VSSYDKVAAKAANGGKVLRRLGLGVAAVVAVLVAALAAVAATRASDRTAVDTAGDDALDAATASVARVLSYDYRHLDEDFRTAESRLTPRFRKQYIATTAKGVQPLADKYKAISTAQVTSAGLVSAATDRVTVLVFVAQQVTNTLLSAPRLDRSRINVTMVRSGGEWLIDGLSPI
jgi:Mce-associated membrane protein